jgi:hypothetical protein
MKNQKTKQAQKGLQWLAISFVAVGLNAKARLSAPGLPGFDLLLQLYGIGDN